MAYNKTNWSTGEPITLNRIMNIENGIENAHNMIEQDETFIQDTVMDSIQTLQSGLTATNNNVTTLTERVNSTTSNSEAGIKAWNEVEKAVVTDANGTIIRGLQDRLSDLESDSGTIKTVLNTARTDINGTTHDNIGARMNNDETDIGTIKQAITSINNDFAKAVIDEDGQDYTRIETRFNADERKIKALRDEFDPIKDDVIAGRGENGVSLNARFAAIETAKESSAKNTTFPSIDARIEEIEQEIVATHNNDAFVSLDARLDKIDGVGNSSMVDRVIALESRADAFNTSIQDNSGRITTLNQTTVKKADIVNDFSTDAETTEKVLDARAGARLNTAITNTTTTANNNTTSINALNTELNMSQTAGHRRLDDIESDISDLETEITGAHSSAANNKSYTYIDDRFEEAESRLNTAESDIDAVETLADTLDDRVVLIANELGMIQNDQYTNTNTRIDTIASDVAGLQQATGGIAEMGAQVDTNTTNIATLQGKVGTLEDTVNGTANSDGLTTRMTAAESAISHAASGNDAGGLTERLTVVEGDLNTASTGIKARLDAIDNSSTGALKSLDDRLDALDGGSALSTTNGTLGARVTALEGKDTIVVSYDGENSNYTNEEPNIENPSTNADYLIEDDNGKYFYWRYFGAVDGWQMVGGAGGGGGGNSSGYDYTSEEDYEAVTPAENVDYYVMKDDGVHHYRWVYLLNTDTGETELTEIEIGCVADTSNIRKYNVALETITDANDNTLNYLNFYEFNADESNAIDANDEDNEIVRLESKRIRHILLPATGGGGAVTSMKFTRITNNVFTSALNSDKPIEVKFFFTTGEENDGAYYDLYIGQIVNNTVVNEKKVISNTIITSGDPANKSTSWPTKRVYADGTTVDENNIDQSRVNEITTVPMTQAEAPKGFYSIDVSQYFKDVGYWSIRLSAHHADNTSITGGINWQLHAINFYLRSEAEDGLIVSVHEPVSIDYTPVGAINKTLHMIIDNDTEHERTVTLNASTTGTKTSITINPNTLEHGLHKIDLYMSAVIDNETITTAHIYREYIWYDAEDEEAQSVIVASRYNGQTINIDAYNKLVIPYSIYHKGNDSYYVEYYRDYGTETEQELGRIQCEGNVSSHFDYIPVTSDDSPETQVITIKVENQMATITLAVQPSTKNLAPIKDALIDFDPTLLTNDSVNREPVFWTSPVTAYASYPTWRSGATYSTGANVIYNGYAYTAKSTLTDETWNPLHWTELGPYQLYLTASENFNWSNDTSGGGYKEDEDGKCFVIKAGSYVDINYKMFKESENGSAVYDTGAEMKIIFKTTAVRDVNAVWFTNVQSVNNKQIGIQLGAHVGWLKTDKASDGAVTADDEYEDWVAGTSYLVDAVIVYDRANDGTIYKCKTANADDEFNEDNWLKIGKIEGKVDATNTYLYFPYSEEDKIELDININKYVSGANNNFIMSYEDGVPSKALPYTYGPSGDGLYHPTGEEATIRIGSPDCDISIYRLRIYGTSLDTDSILQNFIADGATLEEKQERYERNCIYWDAGLQEFKTTKTLTAKLDPVKLAEKMPKVKVLMLDCPTFTLNKKSYIKNSTLRCLQIQKDSRTDEFIYPEEGNWFFQKGYHAGQGTTSDNYGQAGRNVDFLFECDGVNYPAKSKDVKSYTPDGSYVSSLLRGNDTSEWVEVTAKTDEHDAIYAWQAVENAVEEECTGWKDDACKIQLTPTSVPNNYFNLKVNIASSENVNNALFQKRYNDFIAEIAPSPASANQEAQHHYTQNEHFTGPITAKNSMEFVPAVLFIRENDPDLSKHSEFNDTDWHFYALGNIGDSKKTDYTRAYDPTDMNEFTLEISDNNTKNSQFQSGVYELNGERTVEQADSGTNSMNYVWGITNEQWNAKRSPNASELDIRAQINAGNEELVDVIMGGELEDGSDGEVYVNYRHRMLHAEPFDGDHSFEFRYACQGDYRDGSLINPTDKTSARYKQDKAQEKLNRKVFEAFYEWLVTSSDAQFRDEAAIWFVPEAMEFFYAYTHYYTMMDNRAKNTFWHFAKTGTLRAVPIGRACKDLMHVYKESDGNGGYQATTGEFDNSKQYYTEYAFDLWVYDCDTAAGIDNNGALVFPYGKEDTDYRTEGDPLSGMAFNGAGSIFWRRLSRTFAADIRTVMTSANINCFNAQHLINEFDAMQECYPEEIWRLDIERKYIRTFTGKSYDNSLTVGKQNPRFLRSMMQGRKKYQRRQWIRDQGVYFNSKYRLTDIIIGDNTIEFNATTPAVSEWQSKTQYYINDYVRTKVEPFDELKPKFKVWRCIEANNDTNFTAAKWQASVTPSYLLTLTPYQDMYLNVQVGNGNYQPQQRAKAGRTYTFDISGSYQETRIYINGANHLSGIGGLAPMYPYEFDLRALQHIKILDIGTDDPTYTNTKFTTLGLETAKPLLETLNIKNCHSLGGAINLSNANNIRSVYAEGTVVTTVNLPQYTNIETLHLPNTATDISLYAARKLTDFAVVDASGNIDYTHITKLEITDSDYDASINWMTVAKAMINNSQTIRLYQLHNASIGDIQELEAFAELKSVIGSNKVMLGGTIKVTGDYSNVEKLTYERLWQEARLVLDISAGHLVVKHKVTYKYDDYMDDEGTIVPGAEIKTLYVAHGDPIPDIWYDGTLSEMPRRNRTARETYQFGLRDNQQYMRYSGWKIRGDSTYPLSQYTNATRPVVGQDDLVIETYFKPTTREYTVNWYLNRDDVLPIKSATAEYGGGYALIAPTVQEIRRTAQTVKNWSITGNTFSYDIFNGWEKLPIDINPGINDETYDIYANWYHREVAAMDLFAGTTGADLTLEQLFVLSRLSNSQRKTYLPNLPDHSSKMTCTLGHDGPTDGTQIIGGSARAPFRTDSSSFDPSTGVINLKPFIQAQKGFTLAIDYCFNVNQIRELINSSNKNFAVLASTYYVNNGQTSGFSLFYNLTDGMGNNTLGPRLGFGDMYTQIGQSVPIGHSSTAGSRNIIVLRYVPGDETTANTLHIYSGLSTTGQLSLPSDVSYTSITWNGERYPDTKLVFGSVVEPMSNADPRKANYTNIINNSVEGPGTIYWAKYWDYDIGEGECRSVASWPHEEITYGVTKMTSNASQTSTGAIYLNSLEASTHGVVVQPSMNYTTQGWGREENQGGAIARTICNKRVFASMPTLLQSMIVQSTIAYRTVSQQETLYGTSYGFDTNTSFSDDYIYLPSVANLASGQTTKYDQWRNEDANGSVCFIYPWAISTSLTVYNNYNQSSKTWSTESDNNNLQYFNLRFPYQPLNVTSVRVFKGNLGSTNIINAINTNLSGISKIQPGDIYINTSTATAYIFVDTNSINQYGIQYQPREGIFISENDEGAWVPAMHYGTRSMMVGQSSATNFCFVTPSGEGDTQTPSALINTGYNLTYSFAI